MQIAVQRILLAAAVIAFVAAAVVGATGAFFSDTETSTGNTFTAGAIDLKIDSEQHYNGATCVNGVWDSTGTDGWPVQGDPCGGTWELKDLGPTGSTFFNFSDLKPGDNGENTISLHVYDNDAYMCAIIDNMEDVEVAESCTEPEGEDGDVTCALDTPQLGELADELHFFSWLDQGTTPGWQCPDDQPQGSECTEDPGEGDNVWQGEPEEPRLFSNTEGPASDVLDGVVYPLFTPQTQAMEGSSTHYLGLYWCYGAITVGDGTLVCDGSGVDNQSQTDQLTADITFYVEQSRNNDNFVCPGLERDPETATLVVDKIVAFSSTQIAGVDVTDFTLHISRDGGGVDQDVIDEADVTGLPPGTYTITEVYSGVPAGVTFNASFSGSCSEIPADSGTGTITLAGGDDLTCVITNTVAPVPS